MVIKKATPADAKQAWENMELPSCRRVEEALKLAGFDANYRTIYNWQKAGWPEVKQKPVPVQQIVRQQAKQSIKNLDDATVALTAPKKVGRPPAEEEKLSPDEAAVLADLQYRADLDGKSSPEVIEAAAVERAKTNVMIERAIQRNVDFLSKFFPEQLSKLIAALGGSNALIGDPFDVAHRLKGDGMKTINAEPGEDPMNDALKAFRRAKTNGVHA